MSAPAVHDRLEKRLVFDGALVTVTALHVGAGGGSSGVEPSDMPVARDGAGRPYIPGSSLRGSLRAGLEAVLRGIGGRPVCDPLRNDPEDAEPSCSAKVREERSKRTGTIREDEAFDLAWGGSCEICRIFGHTFLASRLRIADLVLETDPRTYVRDGVGIDRELRSAAPGILYQFEAVPAGARFRLRMQLENPLDHELGLLLTGLELLTSGSVGVGGKSARGLGRVEVAGDGAWVQWQPKDFFERTKGTACSSEDLDRWRKSARAYYLGGG